MIRCQKCQAENEDSAKFCAKCGAELATNEQAHTAPAAEEAKSAEATSAQTTAAAAPATETKTEASAPAAKPAAPTLNFMSFIITAITKPVTTLREEISKFSNFQNAAIITVISAAVMMLSGIITAIFNAVIVKRCSLFGSSCKTSIEFDNLGDLDWLKLTLLNFIIYALAMALLAGVYFGMSRVFKQKQTNYCRMLTIVAVSMIATVPAAVIGGLIGMLNAILGILVVSAGSIYAGFMLYEGINNEANITGDKKVYFNFFSIFALVALVCILVLIVTASGGVSTRGLLDLTSL